MNNLLGASVKTNGQTAVINSSRGCLNVVVFPVPNGGTILAGDIVFAGVLSKRGGYCPMG